MIDVTWPKISRWLIAALYVLTIASTTFGFAGHERHGVGIATARAHDAPVCGHAAPHSGKPVKSCSLCCDACTLSAAPILANQITHVVYSVEIATRLEFASSLGRRLDDRPDDLRSRAPPRAA
jgi:hypothetical protein